MSSSVFHNKTILLKFKSPAGKFDRDIFFGLEPRKCSIVSNDDKGTPIEVGSKLFKFPDNSKALELRRMVSCFGFTEPSPSVGNDPFFSLHILM